MNLLSSPGPQRRFSWVPSAMSGLRVRETPLTNPGNILSKRPAWGPKSLIPLFTKGAGPGPVVNSRISRLLLAAWCCLAHGATPESATHWEPAQQPPAAHPAPLAKEHSACFLMENTVVWRRRQRGGSHEVFAQGCCLWSLGGKSRLSGLNVASLGVSLASLSHAPVT